MHHCVASYLSRCMEGSVSVWSLTCEFPPGKLNRGVTVELADWGEIVQCRGFANRRPPSQRGRHGEALGGRIRPHVENAGPMRKTPARAATSPSWQSLRPRNSRPIPKAVTPHRLALTARTTRPPLRRPQMIENGSCRVSYCCGAPSTAKVLNFAYFSPTFMDSL
jgi:hypothetical protein